jgi:Helix-turn-helix of DDE superfamily endonuclease
MKWTSVKKLNDQAFRRLVGVKRSTFAQMVCVLVNYEQQHRRHPKRGRPPKLIKEDQLLMMLMYYREYRTFFHTASSYDISEGQCFRIIVKLESILLKSNLFHLPGKKALLPSQQIFEVVLIDVTESSVERPKKNNGGITQVKRKSTLLKRN